MSMRLAIAAAAAVLVLSGCAAGDTDLQAPPGVEQTVERTVEDAHASVRISASIVVEGLGPLTVSLGPLTSAEHGWLEHEVRFHNPTADLIFLNDSRTSVLLGEPLPRLIVADDGCGYGRADPTAPLEQACRLDFRPAEVPPHGTLVQTVTLWRGLDGMSPLSPGAYVFHKPVRHRKSAPFTAEEGDAAVSMLGEISITYVVALD